MNVQQLCKRLSDLKVERSKYEPHWSDCYRFGAPERQQSFANIDDVIVTRKNQRSELLDSTAAESMQLLVASIISGTTPANAKWFTAKPDGLDDIAELTEGERWLEAVCEFIWRNIHAANFDSESPEVITDASVAGWGVLYIDIDRNDGGYVFENWPIGDCYIASTRKDHVVDTIYRSSKKTAAALVKEYGEDNCSDAVKRAVANSPDQTFTVLHAIQPRLGKHGNVAKKLPFASYHVDIDNKKIMRESGYHEFPCAVPRFRRLPNSVYATGQMSVALPDAKTANKLMETTLRSADLAVGGMWIAEDDGVLNPHTVKVGPRKVIVANSTDSMKRLDVGSDWQVSELLLNKLQSGIRKKLMADQLQPADGPAMTATEVHVRVDLIRQQLGPLYGRFQTEYLIAILDRCFGLALREGVLGQPPEELQGKNISFKFMSPLARAQRLEDVSAIERFMLNLSQVAQVEPIVLDNVNFDNVAQIVGQGLGVPAEILRTTEELQALREQRQQAESEAKEQAQMEQAQGAMGQAALDMAVQQENQQVMQ